VDIRTDNTLGGDATFALLRRREATLTQNVDGFLFVALCFRKRFLALHHSGPGFFAELLHCCCCNFSHDYQYLRLPKYLPGATALGSVRVEALCNEKRSPAGRPLEGCALRCVRIIA